MLVYNTLVESKMILGLVLEATRCRHRGEDPKEADKDELIGERVMHIKIKMSWE